MASVAVLGAGIVGCSTANLLRHELPDSCDVTLVAADFTSDTTSYGAAGIFRMNEGGLAAPERLHRWLSVSFDHYLSLARSEDAPRLGASVVQLYQLYDTPHFERPLHTHFCLGYHELAAADLRAMRLPEGCRSGCLVSTVMLEPRHYLPHLLASFLGRGGRVEQRKVASFAELRQFDLVVNCSAAGSQSLCADDRMFPVRGQVVRVRAPWLRHAVNLNRPDSYIYPGVDSVVVGGIRERGCWSPAVREADTAAVLARARTLEPSLAAAPVQEVWAGVRPCRDELRLEADLSTFEVPVVHNYGHGGYGVMLAHGTATESVHLAREALKRMRHKL